jgi:UPF0716 protein FxsA
MCAAILFLLALGVSDLALLLVYASQLGVLATLAILFLPSLLFGPVAHRVGRALVARVREKWVAGENPSRTLAECFLVFYAGVLLILPGMISSVLGLLLLVPFLRRLVASRISAGWQSPPESAGRPTPTDSEAWGGTVVRVIQFGGGFPDFGGGGPGEADRPSSGPAPEPRPEPPPGSRPRIGPDGLKQVEGQVED